METQRATPIRPSTRLLRVVVAGGLAAAALSVAACGGGGDSAAGTPKGGAATTAGEGSAAALVDQMPAAKGEIDHLTWALPQGEPASLDPLVTVYLNETMMASNFCEPLMKLNPDFTVSPNLAEKVDRPDDKTLVFSIRRGVTFWDGKALTADDVVYSLNRTAQPPSTHAQYFQHVKSVTASGPYEVTVRMKQPDALFFKEMSGPTGAIVQKAFAQKAGKKFGSASGGLMCTGPYKLTSWKAGQSVELTRNDQYWDPELRAKARTVSVKFLADSGALSQALTSGEVDGAYEVPPAIIPSLQKANTGALTQGKSTETLMFGLLHAGGPLDNLDVRSALFWSIDRKAWTEAVFRGTATPNYTLLTAGNFPPEAQDLWQEAFTRYAKEHTLSIDRAKELVQGAGATGSTITLATLAGDATQSLLGQLLQENAQKIGLKVKIAALQPTQYSQLFIDAKMRRNYDVFFVMNFAGIPEPVEPMVGDVVTGAFYNYTGYSNKEMDALVAKAQQTFDPKESARLVIQASDLFEKEPIYTSLLSANEVTYLKKPYTGAITSFAYVTRPSLAYIGAAE